jgi:hypothetical protein
MKRTLICGGGSYIREIVSSLQSDTVPALASRVKQLLGIKNSRCIALPYSDVLDG